jgi:hypothetical protein
MYLENTSLTAVCLMQVRTQKIALQEVMLDRGKVWRHLSSMPT